MTLPTAHPLLYSGGGVGQPAYQASRSGGEKYGVGSLQGPSALCAVTQSIAKHMLTNMSVRLSELNECANSCESCSWLCVSMTNSMSVQTLVEFGVGSVGSFVRRIPSNAKDRLDGLG